MSTYLRSTCTKKNCARRTFMDSDRCFDHQNDGTTLFRVWFVVVALLYVALLAGVSWAVFELVAWVTSR